VIAGSLLLGAFAGVETAARRRAADHSCPWSDVFVQMPGASAREVEERVHQADGKTAVGDSGAWNTSIPLPAPGMSTAIVRFLVGQDEEKSIVRLNQKLNANLDLIPPGASPPLGSSPARFDDVPVLALTFWSKPVQ